MASKVVQASEHPEEHWQHLRARKPPHLQIGAVVAAQRQDVELAQAWLLAHGSDVQGTQLLGVLQLHICDVGIWRHLPGSCWQKGLRFGALSRPATCMPHPPSLTYSAHLDGRRNAQPALARLVAAIDHAGDIRALYGNGGHMWRWRDVGAFKHAVIAQVARCIKNQFRSPLSHLLTRDLCGGWQRVT